MLLEKTLIFVGEEHLTSSFILGLNQLITPFKWCFSLIPILPVALLDMLDAPVPLIVGITDKEYQIIISEGIMENDMDQKVWIHLKLTQKPNEHQYLPMKIENLEALLDEYTVEPSHSIYSAETCTFGNLS